MNVTNLTWFKPLLGFAINNLTGESNCSLLLFRAVLVETFVVTLDRIYNCNMDLATTTQVELHKFHIHTHRILSLVITQRTPFSCCQTQSMINFQPEVATTLHDYKTLPLFFAAPYGWKMYTEKSDKQPVTLSPPMARC